MGGHAPHLVETRRGSKKWAARGPSDRGQAGVPSPVGEGLPTRYDPVWLSRLMGPARPGHEQARDGGRTGSRGKVGEMQTVLVTGGAGFIGGTLVRDLLAQGDVRVVNVDKLTYAGNRDALAEIAEQPNHRFFRGDICDRRQLSRLLREHACDSLIHLAAESHVDRSIEAPLQFVQTNVLGTVTLLDAALLYWESLKGERRDRFRLLHVSTDEVYGSLGPTGKFTERDRSAPSSPYAASKAASDHFVRAYHQTYGLPVLTANCSNTYGPYQLPEKLVPLMIVNAALGQPLPLYGDGSNVRDWLHVQDHCRGLLRVLEQGRIGEVYNLGGDCQLTNLEMVERICRAVDQQQPGPRPTSELIQFVPDRPGHDQRYATDISKAERELGWRPRIDLDRGIAETVQWYLQRMQQAAGLYGQEMHRLRQGRRHAD